MHTPHGPPLSLVRRSHLSMSCVFIPSLVLYICPFFSHQMSSSINLSQPCPCWFLWLLWIRINNCVGELNQKYFIQFLFYTGEYMQHIQINAAVILQPFVVVGLCKLQSLPVLLFWYRLHESKVFIFLLRHGNTTEHFHIYALFYMIFLYLFFTRYLM